MFGIKVKVRKRRVGYVHPDRETKMGVVGVEAERKRQAEMDLKREKQRKQRERKRYRNIQT